MKLYHATHKKNLDSIREKGLDSSYATGKTHCVWMHTASMHAWAALHVCHRHNWRPEDIVFIEINVHYRIRKTCWRGIWRSVPNEVFKPSMIVSITSIELKGVEK